MSGFGYQMSDAGLEGVVGLVLVLVLDLDAGTALGWGWGAMWALRVWIVWPWAWLLGTASLLGCAGSSGWESMGVKQPLVWRKLNAC